MDHGNGLNMMMSFCTKVSKIWRGVIVMKINKHDLKGKIGRIVSWDYKPLPGEHVFVAYIWGNIPVKVRSELTYEQFCKIC